VDDEALARQGMRQLLAEMPEIQVVGEAADADAATELIESAHPDAVFLDIRMPGSDGFALIRGIKNPPKVVFVTAYSEHAVRAFEVEAVDYLLKPVRAERLAEAIQRLRIACSDAAGSAAEAPRYHAGDRICLATPGRKVMVPLDQICALQADGDFTRFYIRGEKSLMICQTLGSYESMLPCPPFLRLDRSLIIHTDRVAKVEHPSRDTTRIELEGIPEPFTVGRKAWSTLRQSGTLDDRIV
jgi:two-component system LytT family response regulator